MADEIHGYDHLDDLNQELLCQAEEDWYTAWWKAWDWCEDQGQCDALGGREFARVTARARFVGLGASEAGMRAFIREQANLSLEQSVTQESLDRRQARRENDHGN